MKHRRPSFKVTRVESALIGVIASRYAALVSPGADQTTVAMNITACHCNGNRLDLQKLAAACDITLLHDVGGISTNLDRRSGRLTNHFSPRCSAPKEPAT